MNPRVPVWLAAFGHDPSTLERDAEGDIKRVPDGTYMLPWTVAFSLWIQERWRVWAAALGFDRIKDNRLPHELAILAGHTAVEFDAWLKENPR